MTYENLYRKDEFRHDELLTWLEGEFAAIMDKIKANDLCHDIEKTELFEKPLAYILDIAKEHFVDCHNRNWDSDGWYPVNQLDLLIHKTKMAARMGVGIDELTQENYWAHQQSGSEKLSERGMEPWEHCGMSFQTTYHQITESYVRSHIFLCRYQDQSYIFGIGIEEPELTEDMLKNGRWLVYTWSD